VSRLLFWSLARNQLEKPRGSTVFLLELAVNSAIISIQLGSKLDRYRVAKKQRTIHLSPILWAQIDDLVNYFGDSPNEVLTRILNDWFDEHQPHIAETKARIDQLQPRIVAIREQAEKETKR
jgi:hypothetical protein